MRGVPSRKPAKKKQIESSMLDSGADRLPATDFNIIIAFLEERIRTPIARPEVMLRVAKALERVEIAIDCQVLKQLFQPWKRGENNIFSSLEKRLGKNGPKMIEARGWQRIVAGLHPRPKYYVEDFVLDILQAEGRYGNRLKSADYLKRSFLPDAALAAHASNLLLRRYKIAVPTLPKPR